MKTENPAAETKTESSILTMRPGLAGKSRGATQSVSQSLPVEISQLGPGVAVSLFLVSILNFLLTKLARMVFNCHVIYPAV